MTIAGLLFAALCSLCTAAPSTKLIIDNCDDADNWRHGEAETNIVREGKAAVRWVPAEQLGLRNYNVPEDWSAGNCLHLWMHSKKATNSKCWMIIYSHNEQRQGPDYYAFRMRIDWQGWREFNIPYYAFGKARTPIGWHKIDGFALHASWDRKAEPSPDDILILDDMRVIQLSETGPRMTDADFFDALDLDREGLEEVRAAVQAGDYEAAKEAFAEYFRARRDVKWFRNWWERPQPQPKGYNTGAAERALDHIYHFDGENYRLGDDIDWSSNQRDEGEEATVEWNAHLNRFPFFNDLSQAYWHTGQDKYAAEIRNMMLDWIEDSPLLLYQSGNSPYHYAWETLNTACRAGDSWINALWRTADSEAWTHDALCTAMKSLIEHARHLLKWPSNGNWLTAESKALTIIGTLLPECEEAENWRKTGINRLYEQMHEEIYPDGIEAELALGYGMWVLRNYANIYDLMKLNDRENDVPQDYKALLERMYNYVLYAMGPDGTVPGFNDSGNVRARRYLKKGAEYFPDRRDFLWGATDGKQGNPPTHNSHAFQYAGHYAMRSDWGENARFLFMDAGPFGMGHQHEDKLTFIMEAYGRSWIVDAGSYMYDDSRWRRYVLSTRGHNTVRVDGCDQHRRGLRNTYVLPKPFEPLDNPWVTNEAFDYVSGTYKSGYGPDRDIDVRHKRQVVFVKPHYWVIFDLLRPAHDQKHQYETLFHINADDARADGTRVHAQAGEQRLDIIGVGPRLNAEIVKGVKEEPVQGWANYPWRPVPTARFSQTADGKICNAYVLYPTDAGKTPPTVRTLSTDSDTMAIAIQTTSTEKHYITKIGHTDEALQAGPVTTDADISIVKVDHAGDVIAAHAIDGSQVRYDGRQVWTEE